MAMADPLVESACKPTIGSEPKFATDATPPRAGLKRGGPARRGLGLGLGSDGPHDPARRYHGRQNPVLDTFRHLRKRHCFTSVTTGATSSAELPGVWCGMVPVFILFWEQDAGTSEAEV